MNHIKIFTSIIGLAALLPLLADGTVLKKLTLDEMVDPSDEVIVGKCEKTEAVWLGKKIYTVASIRVSDSAKGKAKTGDLVKVHSLGGRVNEPVPVEMYVEGAVQMNAGEEMVLFLEKYGAKKEFTRTVGMAQGKVPVSTDPKTGNKRVHIREPIKGVKWVDKNGQPIKDPQTDSVEETTDGDTLDGFLGRVRKITLEHDANRSAASQQQKQKAIGQ